MADLIAEGAQTLTFVRSRRAAELTALGAQARLDDIAPELSHTVASYRAGYLAEDRSALEHALAEGRLRGLATTNALELGVDIAGLDAVVLAGFPGTVASFWQQAGRSGRRGQGALVVLIARDDPLDTYLVHHPGGAAGQAGRAGRDRSRQPLHSRAPTALCRNRTAPRRRRGPRLRRSAGGRGLGRRRAAAAAQRQVLSRARAGTARRGGYPGLRPVVRSSSSRPTPDGCWAAPAPVRPRPRSIPGRCTCTKARVTSSTRWTLEDGIAFVHAEDPGYATFAREITDIAVTGSGRAVDVRASHAGSGAGQRHPSGRRLPAAPAHRGGDRLHRTGHAGAHAAHHRGHVHDHAGCLAAQRY